MMLQMMLIATPSRRFSSSRFAARIIIARARFFAETPAFISAEMTPFAAMPYRHFR